MYCVAALLKLQITQKRKKYKRADHVIHSIEKYTSDITQVHGLGFCVSVEHAKFMAEYFNETGIPSIFLTTESNDEIRNSAKQQLESGKINFIFVVDLYNEGVDIPCVDTVLFLRPTESLTIFLQQLGRGLRLCDGKDCLTVLDFIGQADRRYRFEEKFASLLTKTHQSIKHEIEHGFQSMPHGCYNAIVQILSLDKIFQLAFQRGGRYARRLLFVLDPTYGSGGHLLPSYIELERKAAEYVLDNIKSSLNAKQGIISKIDDFSKDSALPLTLTNFLSYYAWDIRAFYRESLKASFARLCVDANARENFTEPHENQLTAALPCIAAIDSRRWLCFLLRENKKDISGTAPYIFLGTANYVSHTGSKPIDIIWRLDNPIPARFLSATNKLALG